MRIALTLKDLVSLRGIDARITNEIESGLFTNEELKLGKPEGYTDWGLVEFEKAMYYMSSRTFPTIEDDECE